MSHLEEYLRDPLYANWVKSGLALNIANEVLRPFVVSEINKFHESIIRTIRSSCTGCKIDDADICPKGVCRPIKHEIETHHWYPNPSFKNTCTGSWCTDPWEIAKCYIPPNEGSKHCTKSDADFSTSIDVIINCKRFRNYGARDPRRKDKFVKARTFRNAVMHAKDMRITEPFMMTNIDILITILRQTSTTATNYAVGNAISKLNQIKSNCLTLTTENIVQVRKQAMEALGLAKEEVEQGVIRIRGEIEQGVIRFRGEVEAGIEAINIARGQGLAPRFATACQKALRRLTETHIMQQRPAYIKQEVWTLEYFLQSMSIQACVGDLSPRHQQMLFGPPGSHTDIELWDMFTYCFMLTEADLITPIGNAVWLFVEEIQTLRNRLLDDARGVTMDNVLSLLDYLLDDHLKRDVRAIITDQSTDIDAIHANNILWSWRRHDDIYSNIEVKRKEVEQNDKRFHSIEARLTALEIERGITQTATMTETQTELKVRNASPDLVEKLEKTMTSPEENTKVLEGTGANGYMNKMTGCRIQSFTPGCILMNVECPSTQKLFEFWKGCIDGSVEEALSKIRDAYRKYLGCEELEFEVVLKKKEVKRCMEKLEDDWSARLDRLESQDMIVHHPLQESKVKEIMTSMTESHNMEQIKDTDEMIKSTPEPYVKYIEERLDIERREDTRYSDVRMSEPDTSTEVPVYDMDRRRWVSSEVEGGDEKRLALSLDPRMPEIPKIQCPNIPSLDSDIQDILDRYEDISTAGTKCVIEEPLIVSSEVEGGDEKEKKTGFGEDTFTDIIATKQDKMKLDETTSMSRIDAKTDEQRGEDDANRLVKLLNQISGDLEGGKITPIKAHISEMIRYSKEKDEKKFDECKMTFLEDSSFKGGISVDWIRQVIRVVDKIKNNPTFGDLVASKLYEIVKDEEEQHVAAESSSSYTPGFVHTDKTSTQIQEDVDVDELDAQGLRPTKHPSEMKGKPMMKIATDSSSFEPEFDYKTKSYGESSSYKIHEKEGTLSSPLKKTKLKEFSLMDKPIQSESSSSQYDKLHEKGSALTSPLQISTKTLSQMDKPIQTKSSFTDKPQE